MQHLERELAHYGTVLRDRAPAVGLEEVETRLERPPSGHRPVRAAVAGAIVALASIGLVFVGGVFSVLLGTASSIHRPSWSPASGTSTGPAVMAVVVGGGALAVLAGAAAVGLKQYRKKQEPQRIVKTRERRKKKMRTIEKPVAPVEKLARTNRFLIIGLVVAVLAAAGFGAWLIVDNVRTGVEADIEALLDNYGAAWEANDGAAVVNLMTEDAVLWAGDRNRYSVDQIALEVDSAGLFIPERIGEPLIVEHPNFWIVIDAANLTVGGATFPDIGIFRIVEQDGELLIAYHETWLSK